MKIDQRLAQAPCQETVLQYLFMVRSLNQKYTINQINAKFYDQPKLYQEYLDLMDNIQLNLDTTSNLCQTLKEKNSSFSHLQ